MVVVSEKPRSTIAPLAAGASVLGICCGLPLLASAGVLGAVAGIGLGSWLIVALAVVVGVVGPVRWRRGEVLPKELFKSVLRNVAHGFRSFPGAVEDALHATMRPFSQP